MKKPNVLWIMSDQHNANCVGYRNHPNVKTPNLDNIAANGIDFTNAFANNPICSPSRICFMTGQYVKNHGLIGNVNADYNVSNPNTLSVVLRRNGYQTGLFGKSHMVRLWDQEGFDVIKYTDLCDADKADPTTTHYFKYLDDLGLADYYEEGAPREGMEYTLDGSQPAKLPYEHSIERYTGNETIKFLEERDTERPFFIHMSFQRPHSPIAPAKEYFDMYNPEDIVLPDNAYDYFENDFHKRPSFLMEHLKNDGIYPLANKDPNKLKRCLASYYALISCIDMEIGRVIEKLREDGELENTIIFYTADHGDFAGEHGLFHKNFGIYDSIQRTPFLLSYPGCEKGVSCEELVESVDFYKTICELVGIEAPNVVDGVSLMPVINGSKKGAEDVCCEWEWFGKRMFAIRTKEFRLVYYGTKNGGELYDHRVDSGETNNLWDDTSYREAKLELLERLLEFAMNYKAKTDSNTDKEKNEYFKYSPVIMLHLKEAYWSTLKNAYSEKTAWPPKNSIY